MYLETMNVREWLEIEIPNSLMLFDVKTEALYDSLAPTLGLLVCRRVTNSRKVLPQQ